MDGAVEPLRKGFGGAGCFRAVYLMLGPIL